MLSDEQAQTFENCGHVTVPGLLGSKTVCDALKDIQDWSHKFLKQITESQRDWFLEADDTSRTALRKLDNPVFHRPVFEEIARSKTLVSIVEQLIGPGVSVFFSQVFCKPPKVGGPKPVHQDNYYFGPDDLDATLTVWIAIDEAVVENGCLYYADGSHRCPVYPHTAPKDEPFNLQIPAQCLGDFEMKPAPVPAGGISFHHGNTWHQSSNNASTKPRRAAAFHYLRNDASLVKPALEYDPSVVVKVS